MALPTKTGSILNPDQDDSGILNASATLFAGPLVADPRADPPAFSSIRSAPIAQSRRPLAVGVVISIVINLGLLYSWGYFYLPTLSEKPAIPDRTMQVRLQSAEPAKPTPLEEQPLMEPDEPKPKPGAETPDTADTIDEPVRSSATLPQKPETAQPSAEANLEGLLAEPTVVLPADADSADYKLNAPPSSGAFDDVFDPRLRRKLRMREPETNQSLDTVNLNRSTAEDPDQRVSMGEKCFRLEDAGGGSMTQKIWYRAKCRDYDDESETMKRAIQSRLRQ